MAQGSAMTAACLNAVVGYVRRLGAQDTHCLTDRQLLDRFTAQRDEAAFAELVVRHGPMVLSACWRVLRHTQDAEDAFQAAFLVLARKAGSIRQHDSVGGWLYQVAHRLAVRARLLDNHRRDRQVPLGDEHGATTEVPASAVEEEVRRLPEPYRSAVVLCYLEGRTQAEAARLLATTADAVNSRLKRARDLLRQRLARAGLALSGVAVAEQLAVGAAPAALPPTLARLTAQAATQFVTGRAAAGGITRLAAALAQGALGMTHPNVKFLSALVLAGALLAAGALLGSSPAQSDPTPPQTRKDGQQQAPGAQEQPAPKGGGKGKRQPSVIILWMGGGPSQFETFDPKAAAPNQEMFKSIDTSIRGVKFSETLPNLAKLANRLTVIRSLTSREADHLRGTYLMRTGHAVDGGVDYPSLASALAKELGDGRPGLPHYIRVGGAGFLKRTGFGPGFLGPKYGAVLVGSGNDNGQVGFNIEAAPVPFAKLPLPSIEAFNATENGKGKEHRKAVAKAFALNEEQEALRRAYGPGRFGQGCLLARRLVERGVPVVEIHLGGWDAHANLVEIMKKRCAELDAGFGSLLKDLEERKLLDSTLIVWAGEFGRTPRVNANGGRDHWSMSFTVVLAGAGTRRGQVVGKTDAAGIKIEERPVTVPEFLATVYRAVGVDATRTNRVPNGGPLVPLVVEGRRPSRRRCAEPLPSRSASAGPTLPRAGAPARTINENPA